MSSRKGTTAQQVRRGMRNEQLAGTAFGNNARLGKAHAVGSSQVRHYSLVLSGGTVLSCSEPHIVNGSDVDHIAPSSLRLVWDHCYCDVA